MYKYYKSDFPVHIKVGLKRETSTGEVVPVTTDVPFNLRFYVKDKGTAETGYLASYDGETVHNCTILSQNDIMVFYDRTQMPLPTGNLLVEVEFIVSDQHYEGDDENNLKRLYSTGIELTDREDLHDEGEVTIDIFNEVIAHELIEMAEQKATEAAQALVPQVAEPIAREVAERVVSEYTIAPVSMIDALWAED